MNDQGDVVRAGEIGQYAFCARAWWLERVQGIPSENVRELAAGVAGHRTHGRVVVQADRLRRLGVVLLTFAAVVAILLTWMLVGHLTW
jgi:hypothetical protein